MTAARNDDGRRLDRVLRKARPELPLSFIHRLFREKHVMVNGRPAAPAYRVQEGDAITLKGGSPPEPCRAAADDGERPAAGGGADAAAAGSGGRGADAAAAVGGRAAAGGAAAGGAAAGGAAAGGCGGAAVGGGGLRVVYETDGLLFVNKPAGMAVHSGGGGRWADAAAAGGGGDAAAGGGADAAAGCGGAAAGGGGDAAAGGGADAAAGCGGAAAGGRAAAGCGGAAAADDGGRPAAGGGADAAADDGGRPAAGGGGDAAAGCGGADAAADDGSGGGDAAAGCGGAAAGGRAAAGCGGRAADDGGRAAAAGGGADAAAAGGLRVVYETDGLLFVNKPAGMAVHSGGGGAAAGEGGGTLDGLARAYLDGKILPSLSFAPGPLHRLDRGTSGLIAFSKSLAGARAFTAALRGGEITKIYLAILEGAFPGGGAETLWDAPLFRNKDTRKTIAGGNAAKPALTAVLPLACRKRGGAEYTLARIRIATGRTHQIRAHAAFYGHPLYGDVKYGGRKNCNCGRKNSIVGRKNCIIGRKNCIIGRENSIGGRKKGTPFEQTEFFLHAAALKLPPCLLRPQMRPQTRPPEAGAGGAGAGAASGATFPSGAGAGADNAASGRESIVCPPPLRFQEAARFLFGENAARFFKEAFIF